MIRIEDDNYGVMYLAPLCNNWYVQFDEDYPYYVLLNKRKIVQCTRDVPHCVWEKI